MKKVNALSLIGILMILILSSCSGLKEAKTFRNRIADDTNDTINGESDATVSFTYTGCGGFEVKRDSTVVSIDPFFTFWKLRNGLRRYETNTALIDLIYDKCGNIGAITKMMLFQHNHYDHTGDVPYILNTKINPSSIIMAGSKNSYDFISEGLKDNLRKEFDRNYKDAAHFACSNTSPGRWIYSKDSSLRVLPVLSKHASHLHHFNFIPTRIKFKTRKKYRIGQIRDCKTNYNYMLDFLNKDTSVAVRIFVHSGSSSTSPVGFPPEELIKRPVDILLLCVASHKEVKRYPNEIVKYVNPNQIILAHWENFFRDYTQSIKNPGTLKRYRGGLNSFFRKLDKTLDVLGKDSIYILPRLLSTTTITIQKNGSR